MDHTWDVDRDPVCDVMIRPQAAPPGSIGERENIVREGREAVSSGLGNNTMFSILLNR